MLPFTKVQDTLESSVHLLSEEELSSLRVDHVDFKEVCGFVEQIRCFCDKLHKCADALEDAGFSLENCDETGENVKPGVKVESKEESKEEFKEESKEQLEDDSHDKSKGKFSIPFLMLGEESPTKKMRIK